MRYRALGRTGLTVSEIGLGAWFIGGMYGDVPLDDARAIIKRALDLGVNTFDTADVYGNGLSERVLGEELRGYDVNVFTKVGYNIYQREGGKVSQTFNPSYIRYAVSKSIERLGRRVNLLQLHNPPLNVIRDWEVHSALINLVKDGYVEHVGVALGPEVNVLNEGLAAIKEGYESIMFVFNALEQEPGRALIRAGVEGGVGLITRVPHASNVLTNNFTQSFPPSDHRSLRRRDWLIKAKAIVDEYVKPISDQLGITLSQLALKFILSYPVSTVIVTVTSVKELEEYVEAADGGYLSPRVLGDLERLYDELISIRLSQ
ncbi:MAG: aldo/keto reductase [Caldivirga sp.]|jgi:aryl-alcohol dehydrogenase-like predicted oxidoreductase